MTDSDGASTSSTIDVTVNNQAPVITSIIGETNVNEGEEITYLALAFDKGNDSLIYSWDFGDNTNVVIGSEVTHVFTNNGNYTVTLTVTDSDGASTSQTLDVIVNNVAPVVEAKFNQIMYVDEIVNFEGSFTDVGLQDTHEVTWNYGDGTIITYTPNSSTLPTFTHIYQQAGIYMVTLTITDNDGGVTQNSSIINIKPLPTISVSALTITEGDNGINYAVFIVSLSEASSRIVTADFITNANTAAPEIDYISQSGSLIFNQGETTKTISIEVKGDNIHEDNESFFLSLTNPINATIIDSQAVGNIIDNDALPTLIINDKTIIETDSGTQVITFTVTLSGATEKTVTVDYITIDNTAQVNNDYIFQSGSLIFNQGETTKTISIEVKGDNIHEDNESFFLSLTNPINATIIDSQAVGNIIDNDALPSLSIADKTITETDSGQAIMTFTVTLSQKSEKIITVQYNTANGTAIAGSDYLASSGILTFNPGETTKTISIAIEGDRLDEVNESMFVNLFAAINATIVNARAIGTIIDEDASPILTVTTNPKELWPPNHKMVQIQPIITVSDDDSNPYIKLVSITSNEPDNGLGDGDTAGDIQILPDGRIFLRAERSSNGNGRVYTLTYSATDSAGNVTYSTTYVRVPKNK